MANALQPRAPRIGLLLFDGVTALDVAGPMEAFASTRVPADGRHKTTCYELLTIGLTNKSITAESGLTFKPSTTLATCPPLDTLIIPGGRGLREPRINRTLAAWIKNRAATTRRIASVCTGIYVLAPTGLLDGATVTTHWRFAEDVARKFPALHVDAKTLFHRHGNIYTSAGITAGIDLSLNLIEDDYGRSAALSVARELVVFMKRRWTGAVFRTPAVSVRVHRQNNRGRCLHSFPPQIQPLRRCAGSLHPALLPAVQSPLQSQLPLHSSHLRRSAPLGRSAYPAR